MQRAGTSAMVKAGATCIARQKVCFGPTPEVVPYC